MPEVLYKRDGWCYIVLSTHYPSSKYKREKTKKDKEIMNVKNVRTMIHFVTNSSNQLLIWWVWNSHFIQ